MTEHTSGYSGLGNCPDCGTELVPYHGRRRPRVGGRPASWCWKCQRVLRAGEAREAQTKGGVPMTDQREIDPMYASPQFWESAPVDDPKRRVYFTAESDGRVIAGASPLGAMLTYEQVASLTRWLIRVGGLEAVWPEPQFTEDERKVVLTVVRAEIERGVDDQPWFGGLLDSARAKLERP